MSTNTKLAETEKRKSQDGNEIKHYLVIALIALSGLAAAVIFIAMPPGEHAAGTLAAGTQEGKTMPAPATAAQPADKAFEYFPAQFPVPMGTIEEPAPSF